MKSNTDKKHICFDEPNSNSLPYKSNGNKNYKNDIKNTSYNFFRKNINLVSLKARYNLIDIKKLKDTNGNNNTLINPNSQNNLFEKLKKGSHALVIDDDIIKGSKEKGIEKEMRTRTIINNTLDNLKRIESENEKFILVKINKRTSRGLPELSPIDKKFHNKIYPSSSSSSRLNHNCKKIKKSINSNLDKSKGSDNAKNYKEKYERALQFGKLEKPSRKIIKLTDNSVESVSHNLDENKYEDLEHFYIDDKKELFKKYLHPKKIIKLKEYSDIMTITDSMTTKAEFNNLSGIGIINKNNNLYINASANLNEGQPKEIVVKNCGFLPIKRVIDDDNISRRDCKGKSFTPVKNIFEKKLCLTNNFESNWKRKNLKNLSHLNILSNKGKQYSFLKTGQQFEANITQGESNSPDFKYLGQSLYPTQNNEKTIFNKFKIPKDMLREGQSQIFSKSEGERKSTARSDLLKFQKSRKENLINTIQTNFNNLSNVDYEIKEVLSYAFKELNNQPYNDIDTKVNQIDEIQKINLSKKMKINSEIKNLTIKIGKFNEFN